jgi:hypothetical protein
VEVGENFADGLVGKSELRCAHDIAHQGYSAADGVLELIVNERLPQNGTDRTEREIFAALLTDAATASYLEESNLGEVLGYRANRPSDLAAQSQMLRDIFGNPFYKVKFNKKWRTDTAVALAKQMYEAREFSDAHSRRRAS